jgi:hypothetical protein
MRKQCSCGNLVEKSHTRANGEPVYRDECRTCRGRYRYGILKGNYCELCGFVPQVSAQLEIDHIDGDRNNNHKDNLQTLCCNCHALKSYNENIRFPANKNPFYGRKHSIETLEKIRSRNNAIRKEQG